MLPSDWVDGIFGKLAVRYGAAFTRQWDGIDPALVKADWAEVLSGFTADDIAYALAHLPSDRAPNSSQFRDICRLAPRNGFASLPAPRERPSAAVVGRLRAITSRRWGDRAWAERLRAREEAGESLSQFQRDSWRQALAAPLGSSDDEAKS
jgi:hypothetical protein